MPEDRRHAAIMFTDIVGYTALMGRDEDAAFDMLARNHALHEALIEKHHGILIKEVGDGTLASFPLASNAVRCAIDIQKEAKAQDIPLKIGIHEGEMVFAGTDVLGDGVNIASRLQEDAKEGCINISAAVYSNIKNKVDIQTTKIGEKFFKNVDEPVKVYEVHCEKEAVQEALPEKTQNKRLYYAISGILVLIVAVVLIWFIYPRQQVFVDQMELDKSIAVIPFVNMSNDQDQEYFCDGMMEEILTHLYKIGDLRVTSRTSVMGYKGTNKKVPEIAKELGVAYILEGSVRKSQDRVRITIQLIDSTKDQHLWAETYDRELADIFSIQSEVAQKVATSLKAVISPEVRDRIEAVPTNNMTAYDFYLKGNEAYWRSWNGRIQSTMLKSIEYYEKAIELDPNFSLAFTGLGRSHWWLGMEASIINRAELYEKSKMYLQKAIDLDIYNGWAYAELSVVTMDWDWDSTSTRYNLDMAMKLMPNDPNVYIHYFHFEDRLGNCDRMISTKNSLKRFFNWVDDPISEYSLGILRCQKKFAEIAKLGDEYWDGKPFPGTFSIFFSYLLLNEYSKAERVLSSVKVKRFYYVLNGMLKAKEGDHEIALSMCDSLESINARNSLIAEIYAAMGDKKQMYEYLNKALMEREAMHQYIDAFPLLIDCQSDPEFQKILLEMWTPRKDY